MDPDHPGYPWIWDKKLEAYVIDPTARVVWSEGSNPRPLEGRYYEPRAGVCTD